MAEEEEEEEEEWVCNACTFHNQGSCSSCSMCGTVRLGFPWLLQQYSGSLSICNLPRLLGNMLSCALTGAFALVGAFTGAITGGLAGRAAQSGLLRGAGLGAVAGAVLSVEVLEASRAYWHSERSGPSSIPSLSDFVEDLISGRFVQDFLVPAVSSTRRWQVSRLAFLLCVFHFGAVRMSYKQVVRKPLCCSELHPRQRDYCSTSVFSQAYYRGSMQGSLFGDLDLEEENFLCVLESLQR